MSKQLFSNINLDKISFSRNGVSITLDFLDMYEGLPFASFICEPVISFHYENMFERGDELPCYIGEIWLKKIPNEEINNYLTNNKYRFVSDSFANGFGDLYSLSLIGGEIVIHIICSDVMEKRKGRDAWTILSEP